MKIIKRGNLCDSLVWPAMYSTPTWSQSQTYVTFTHKQESCTKGNVIAERSISKTAKSTGNQMSLAFLAKIFLGTKSGEGVAGFVMHWKDNTLLCTCTAASSYSDARHLSATHLKQTNQSYDTAHNIKRKLCKLTESCLSNALRI